MNLFTGQNLKAVVLPKLKKKHTHTFSKTGKDIPQERTFSVHRGKHKITIGGADMTWADQERDAINNSISFEK
jgi:hypothetical protein